MALSISRNMTQAVCAVMSRVFARPKKAYTHRYECNHMAKNKSNVTYLKGSWMKQAKDYLDSAKTLLESPSPKPVAIGLLSWQGSENSLKAICFEHNVPRKHDLSSIMAHIQANNLITIGEYDKLSLALQVVTSSTSYTDIRYPDKDPDFWEKMPRTELKKRVASALIIYEICSSNLATSS